MAAADARLVRPERPTPGRESGSITSVEAFVLAVMAVIVVAVAVPSYLALQGRAHDSAARAQVRDAVDAAETYRAERDSYAGLSVAALTRVSPRLDTAGLTVQRSAAGYCVQASDGGRTWHAQGPAGELARGRCP